MTSAGDIYGPGLDGILRVDYTFSGTATTVPEPFSLLLVNSGLAGLAGVLRRRSGRRRVVK